MPADQRDDGVGYGKPPQSTRFRKGHSGNPKGRPKGRKTLAALLMQALTETVFINENGRRRKVSKLEVMTKQLANKAATADLGAMKLLFGMIQLLDDRDAPAATNAIELSEADHDVIRELVSRLRNSTKGNGNE
jgi:hypothetical protein